MLPHLRLLKILLCFKHFFNSSILDNLFVFLKQLFDSCSTCSLRFSLLEWVAIKVILNWVRLTTSDLLLGGSVRDHEHEWLFIFLSLFPFSYFVKFKFVRRINEILERHLNVDIRNKHSTCIYDIND